eukprot:Gregarina_sp_Poly_1__4846@NODE_257_length_10511_cov_261_924071_g224_i0_p9_GENE_NODE_257_length_10511_cov_261_924071_g224_i0NODE_257_length_10511_cov_261_924071_g224_i0_p9_ORF_typecomplete_len172_score6_50_NODE_257_length_10511_cov_261_924071_g224_i012811796
MGATCSYRTQAPSGVRSIPGGHTRDASAYSATRHMPSIKCPRTQVSTGCVVRMQIRGWPMGPSGSKPMGHSNRAGTVSVNTQSSPSNTYPGFGQVYTGSLTSYGVAFFRGGNGGGSGGKGGGKGIGIGSGAGYGTFTFFWPLINSSVASTAGNKKAPMIRNGNIACALWWQ